jgi:hypothetical protein
MEPAPDLVLVAPPAANYAIVINTATGATLAELEGSEIEDYCGSGSLSDPQAESGNICVYEVPSLTASISGGVASPDPESGAAFTVLGTPGATATGSWALNTE